MTDVITCRLYKACDQRGLRREGLRCLQPPMAILDYLDYKNMIQDHLIITTAHGHLVNVDYRKITIMIII